MRRHRRLGIYPVPFGLLFIGYQLALLWVFGRKWRWRCTQCGLLKNGHSIASRIYRILFWIGFAITVLMVLVVLAAVFFLLWLELLGPASP